MPPQAELNMVCQGKNNIGTDRMIELGAGITDDLIGNPKNLLRDFIDHAEIITVYMVVSSLNLRQLDLIRRFFKADAFAESDDFPACGVLAYRAVVVNVFDHFHSGFPPFRKKTEAAQQKNVAQASDE